MTEATPQDNRKMALAITLPIFGFFALLAVTVSATEIAGGAERKAYEETKTERAIACVESGWFWIDSNGEGQITGCVRNPEDFR